MKRLADADLRAKAVLFDKDGTLFDFAASWESWAEAFLLRAAQGNRGQAARIGAEIGFDLTTRRFSPDSVAIAGTPGEVAEALAPHFPNTSRVHLIDLLNEEAVRAPQAEAVPLIPFLKDLRDRGLLLGVATNDAEGSACAHLEAARVMEFFDFVAGFDSGYGAKPAPGQLLAFAQAVGLAPEHCVMVGDSTHDLHAGRAAGMQTVAVLTGLASPAELRPLADVVLPDIGSLPEWLRQTPPHNG